MVQAQRAAEQARALEQKLRVVDVFQSLPGGNQPPAPFIVDFGEIKEAGARQALSEDLTIMHRILVKAATDVSSPPSPPTAMGIAVSNPAEKAGPQSLYLSGLGAVFFLDVKFPLLGPPAEKTEKAAEAKPRDNTWERTKRELYGQPQTPTDVQRKMELRMMTRYGIAINQVSPPVEFNATQVESLKQELLKALANASNIHGLKPEDTVIVVVRGGPVAKETRTVNNEEIQHTVPNGVSVNAIGVVTTYAEPVSTLSIRIKKADAMAFADGKLTQEQFAKQAKIAIY